MANPICQALGIRYPILLGGLLKVGTAPLVAAVSNAGGFGILGAGGWNREELRKQIHLARERTDRPFGVNIVVRSPLSEDHVDVVMEEGIPAVSSSAGNPARYTARLKENGIYVMHVVPTVDYALLAQEADVDAIIAEGSESGGYTSLEEISTFVLIPQVVDAVSCPVIAAGGIGDGRGLAAALALGAVGVQMGTRFLGTTEAEVPEGYKLALVMAKDTDTKLVRSSKAAQRQVKEELRAQVAAALDEAAVPPGLTSVGDQTGDWEAHLKAKKVPRIMSAGQVAGLIHEIIPAREVIERMVEDARQILSPTSSRIDLIA